MMPYSDRGILDNWMPKSVDFLRKKSQMLPEEFHKRFFAIEDERKIFYGMREAVTLTFIFARNWSGVVFNLIDDCYIKHRDLP